MLETYAQQQAHLKRMGRRQGKFARLIGRVAVAHGLTLVMPNTHHFADMVGTGLADWVQAKTSSRRSPYQFDFTYLSLMRITLELEFPDEQAASFVQLLQALLGLTTRFLQADQYKQLSTLPAAEKKLTTAEEEALLHSLFGAWKNGVSGEEMVREIYEGRDSGHREVEL